MLNVQILENKIMDVKYYYVTKGHSMPSSYTEGSIYFDANTLSIYRAKSATEIESFGGADSKLDKPAAGAYIDDSYISPNIARTSEVVSKSYVDSLSLLRAEPLEPSGENGEISLEPGFYYNLGNLNRFANSRNEVSIATPFSTAEDPINSYAFSFYITSDVTIIWETGIKFLGGEPPVIETGKLYEVSIIDNLAVVGEFNNE